MTLPEVFKKFPNNPVHKLCGQFLAWRIVEICEASHPSAVQVYGRLLTTKKKTFTDVDKNKKGTRQLGRCA